MSKAKRNRAIRREARELDPIHARSVARSLRRHGRLPLEMWRAQRRKKRAEELRMPAEDKTFEERA